MGVMIIFFWTIDITSASLHGGHFIKDDKWCPNGGRRVYMRDREGGEIIYLFFRDPECATGRPTLRHCSIVGHQSTKYSIAYFINHNSQNVNYMHGGVKLQ